MYENIPSSKDCAPAWRLTLTAIQRPNLVIILLYFSWIIRFPIIMLTFTSHCTNILCPKWGKSKSESEFFSWIEATIWQLFYKSRAFSCVCCSFYRKCRWIEQMQRFPAQTIHSAFWFDSIRLLAKFLFWCCEMCNCANVHFVFVRRILFRMHLAMFPTAFQTKDIEAETW